MQTNAVLGVRRRRLPRAGDFYGFGFQRARQRKLTVAVEATVQPALTSALQPALRVDDYGPTVTIFYFTDPDGVAYLTPDGEQVYLAPEGV